MKPLAFLSLLVAVLVLSGCTYPDSYEEPYYRYSRTDTGFSAVPTYSTRTYYGGGYGYGYGPSYYRGGPAYYRRGSYYDYHDHNDRYDRNRDDHRSGGHSSGGSSHSSSSSSSSRSGGGGGGGSSEKLLRDRGRSSSSHSESRPARGERIEKEQKSSGSSRGRR